MAYTKHKAIIPIKICRNCGLEFQKQKVKWYCSRLCWNIHWKGKNTHMFGRKLSKDTRKKLSEYKKGNTYRLGTKTSPETSIKLSLMRRGSKHWNWKKDRSQVKLDTERGGPLHKQWSKNIKDRDGWRCRIQDHNCQGKVVAHHILPWAKFPELRYKLNNGITLCQFHHPRKRDDEMNLSPYFQNIVAGKEK